MKYKISLVLTALMLSGCSAYKLTTAKSDFDTNPNNYHAAQVTKDIDVPKYIASNLEKQPLYPVPPTDNLSGDLNISAVPPNLKGKIAE